MISTRIPLMFAALAVAGSLLAAPIDLGPLAGTSYAQEPPYNRHAGFLSVVPDASDPSRQQVQLAWFLEVNRLDSPADLSTRAELRVNGVTRASQILTIPAEWGGGCTGPYPWCGGHVCGSIGFVPLFCHNSCAGGTPCGCHCGHWLMYDFGPEPYAPGDEIMVTLYPAPGAAPEEDRSDDTARVIYDGAPIFWDRTAESIQLTPVPGAPETYDVEAAGRIVFDGMPQRWMDLSFFAVLELNGEPVDSHLVQAEVEQAGDITCFQLGCGSYCGTHNGIAKDCAGGHFLGGCVCGGDWLVFFPGVGGIGDDDILTLRLVVANAGVPEVIGENDLIRLSGTTSVDPPAALRRNGLQQNRPNPLALSEAGAGTVIDFSLDQPGQALVEVIDIHGRKIRTLADGALPAGSHTVRWDGTDASGRPVPAGAYFYRLHDRDQVLSRKMLVVD